MKQKKKEIETEDIILEEEKKPLDVSNASSDDELVLESDRPFLERFGRGFVNFWRNKSTIDTLKYIGKRLLLMVLTFGIVFVLCFILVRLLPINEDTGMGDPEKFKLSMVAKGVYRRIDNGDGTYSYEMIPVFLQFINFFKNLFSGTDHPFGYSYKIEWLSSPADILGGRLAPTVLMNIYVMIVSVPVGLGLGTFMALRKNHWEDHVLSVLIMLVISVPSYVYAFVLQYLFGYVWQVLPPMAASSTVGYTSPTYFVSIILPVLSMCFGSIAGYARYTRAELTEVLTSDFMLLARTKGLTRGQATVRHAFRNSLVPIFPMILGEIIGVLSGSMIIEAIFNVNGVGGLYLQSIQSQDYDVFQFVSMFYIFIGLVGTLVVDVSYGIVDPRIRMGGGK